MKKYAVLFALGLMTTIGRSQMSSWDFNDFRRLDVTALTVLFLWMFYDIAKHED